MEKMKLAIISLYFVVLMLCGILILHAMEIDRKFRAMDERMWNVENAQ